MRIAILLLLSSALSAPGFCQKPQNVIVMIGDGMGLTQLTAAFYANQQSLAVARFPVSGLQKTSSSSHLITDSGAAATAMACGVKTYNKAIGVDKRGNPCLTLMEQAKSRGMRTGLAVSSSLTHATPASFVAHVKDRNDMEAIADYFVGPNLPDLAIGGGEKYFIQRKDKRNLLDSLRQKNVQVFSTGSFPWDSIPQSAQCPLFVFTDTGEPVTYSKGRTYLPTAVQAGCQWLQQNNTQGFFFLVEGSQIDWACHGNAAQETISETLDFNRAVEAAVTFAEKDGNTLVLVTADHETGGMALVHSSDPLKADIQFNTGNHTATLVPVYAFGPGAEAFHGIYDNTEISAKIRELMAW